MKESDWKLFKKVKKKALEKFCADALSEVGEVVNNAEGSHHDKYLHLYKLIESTDTSLGRLFDGHSRSHAALQLMLLRSEGLVADSDLDGMSEAFVKMTTPQN